MKIRRLFLIAAALWLLFIWGNSLLPPKKSVQLSTQVTNIVMPDLKDYAVPEKSAELRESAHLIEFALLGALLVAGLEKGKNFWQRPAFTAAACLLVALLDETFQMLNPGRGDCLEDVWRDFAGAMIGIVALELLLFAIVFVRKVRQKTTV